MEKRTPCDHGLMPEDCNTCLRAALAAAREENAKLRTLSEPHEDVRRTAYVVELEKRVAKLDNALEELERVGWPCRLEELPQQYVELGKKLQEAREEVFDLYHLACCVYNPLMAGVGTGDAAKYDNMAMSTYESIEDKLIEWGLLKPEQCLRRKVPVR